MKRKARVAGFSKSISEIHEFIIVLILSYRSDK